MSILWCGGEDIDFPNGAQVYVTTAYYYYNGNFSRCALNAGSENINTIFFTNPISFDLQNIWASCRAYLMNTFSGTVIGVSDANKKGIYVIQTITGGAWRLQLALYDGISNWTVLATASQSTVTTAIYKIDLFISEYSTNSHCIVYRDWAPIIDFTGDITIAGAGTLNRLASGGSYGVSMSEFILANEDTRILSLKSLIPNEAGDASEFVNDYTAIDDVTIATSDSIYTNSINNNFQCKLTGMPTGDFICKAVKMAAYAVSDVSTIGIQIGIKTNNVVDLGSSVALDTVWGTVEKLYQQNPITSSAFTSSDIEGLQFAVKSVTV